MSGHRYTAEEAIAAGIADAMASEEELLGKAKEMASALATKERGIFGKLKQTLNASAAEAYGDD